MFELVADIV